MFVVRVPVPGVGEHDYAGAAGPPLVSDAGTSSATVPDPEPQPGTSTATVPDPATVQIPGNYFIC